MRERDIALISAALVFESVILACGVSANVAPAAPDASGGGVNPQSTEPVQFDRRSSVVATAQSVSAKGPDGLAAENFPVEALKASRSIHLGWDYNLVVNDQPTFFSSVVPCDATVINVPSKDAFVLQTAVHCVSAKYEAYSTRYTAEPEHPGQKVDVTDMQLKTLTFDSENLQRNQFGVVVAEDDAVESSSTGYDGVAYIYIPKANLNPAELIYLESTALNLNQISFDPPAPGALHNAYCSTEEFGGSINTVMQNATVISEDANEAALAPASLGGGCSGGGVYRIAPDGKSYLVGAIMSIYKQQPYFEQGVNTYKLSNIGATGFDSLVNSAEQDYLAQPK